MRQQRKCEEIDVALKAWVRWGGKERVENGERMRWWVGISE